MKKQKDRLVTILSNDDLLKRLKKLEIKVGLLDSRLRQQEKKP